MSSGPTTVAPRVETLANGATYRPRKNPVVDVSVWGYNDALYVVVWRTHDVELASRLAQVAVDREVGEHVTLPEPKQTWLKVVPWSEGHDGDSTIIEVDPKRGTPCVEYRFPEEKWTW